jgi:hypothetical protein
VIKKNIGLEDAIESIVDYLTEQDPKRCRIARTRLRGNDHYWGSRSRPRAHSPPNLLEAFVPNNGECLNDMIPPQYVALFDSIQAQRGDRSVVLPFPIWREAFINDARELSRRMAS